MTRTVRFREIDGQLMFPIPEDVVKRLGLSIDEPVSFNDDERRLTIEKISDRARLQFELGLKIIEEDDAVLAALAK